MVHNTFDFNFFLPRELSYRMQLNEQQNNMIAQQRAQLSMGRDEITSIDDRIVELQARTNQIKLLHSPFPGVDSIYNSMF